MSASTRERPRLVVKVGSSSLVDGEGIKQPVFRAVTESITGLRDAGSDVVLVSSGAIALGMQSLHLSKRPEDIHARQALASIGQPRLIAEWTRHMAPVVIGQALYTWGDLGRHSASISVQECLRSLFSYGCVPIVNENDAVGTQEINFGDNDILAAMLARRIGANALVLLTTHDGIMNFKDVSGPELLRTVSLGDIARYVRTDMRSEHGTGGVKSKIEAAEIAHESGTRVFVGNAAHAGVIENLLAEGNRTVGTEILAL